MEDEGVVKMKTDEQIKKIVFAAIRRKSMDIETWKHTRIWDEGEIEINSELFKSCQFENNELPILYSYFDSSNWMLFATKSIQYSNKGLFKKIKICDIKNYDLGNFKGYSDQLIETISIETEDKLSHKCLYETGKASTGSIYALMTLLQIS